MKLSRLLPVLMGRGAKYYQKVLSIQPANLIAFWRLNETSGTAAVDSSPEGNNGTYTGVDLANAAGPDGVLVPYWDGVNDYINIDSAGLDADFDDTECTLSVWVKPVNWNDGANHQIIEIQNNVPQRLTIAKTSTADKVEFRWFGGNLDVAGITNATNAWMHFAITRSEAANEVKLWVNGAQVSTTKVSGSATGVSISLGLIGAYITTPAAVWKGWIANVALWKVALTPAEILALATV